MRGWWERLFRLVERIRSHGRRVGHPRVVAESVLSLLPSRDTVTASRIICAGPIRRRNLIHRAEGGASWLAGWLACDRQAFCSARPRPPYFSFGRARGGCKVTRIIRRHFRSWRRERAEPSSSSARPHGPRSHVPEWRREFFPFATELGFGTGPDGFGESSEFHRRKPLRHRRRHPPIHRVPPGSLPIADPMASNWTQIAGLPL